MQNGETTTLNGSRKHAPLSIEEFIKLSADDEKIKLISQHFRQIMLLLGLDPNDDSLKGTPDRVAKMYVKEMFSGLNPATKPEATLFENRYCYDEMLVEKTSPFIPVANIILFPSSARHTWPILLATT